MKSNRILYIVQHRFNRSPGQRYRCEQYISYLEQNGFECTFSPIIINADEDRALYQSKNIFSKAAIFIKAFYRRIKDVLRAKDYGIIFIYREAFMTGSLFFEKMLKKSGAKIILDFDDAIWLPSVSEVNKSLQWMKHPEKVNEIIALSGLTITGNNYLAAYARNFNPEVLVFPSTIDLDYYKIPSSVKSSSGTIIIGWSGSHTTVEHFETLLPVLKKLKEKYADKISFVLYGDDQYINKDLSIKGMAWSAETEVEIISSFDIGIMPLPDNEWSKGKCAMKGLQYMGLKVASVLADVGMNKDLVQEGVNGFLAKSEEEWLDKLQLLIEDKALRDKLGAAGRKTVEERFSCQARQRDYVNIFLELSRKN